MVFCLWSATFRGYCPLVICHIPPTGHPQSLLSRRHRWQEASRVSVLPQPRAWCTPVNRRGLPWMFLNWSALRAPPSSALLQAGEAKAREGCCMPPFWSVRDSLVLGCGDRRFFLRRWLHVALLMHHVLKSKPSRNQLLPCKSINASENSFHVNYSSFAST